MYEKPDFYSKKANKEGYPARSIYKLEEMNDKFKLFSKGQRILDLGCAPGSWSQYVSKIIGSNGLVVGIDYRDVKISAKNARFITGDFLDKEVQKTLSEFSPFDAIISDMAPDTSGDKLSDCYRSSELVLSALRFSYDFLKKGGLFVAKIFQGGDEKEIMNELDKAFHETKWFKPKSSRKSSFEIFMLGIDFISKPEMDIFEEMEENEALKKALDTGEMPW
jgi:23S rRNA (uridine2552-2'-O)-methyltransferase